MILKAVMFIDKHMGEVDMGFAPIMNSVDRSGGYDLNSGKGDSGKGDRFSGKGDRFIFLL